MSDIPDTFVEERLDKQLWTVRRTAIPRTKLKDEVMYAWFEDLPKPIQRKVSILKLVEPLTHVPKVGVKSACSLYILYILE